MTAVFFPHDGAGKKRPQSVTQPVPEGIAAFFDVSPEALLLVECSSQRIVAANPAAAQLYGYAKGVLNGRFLHELCSEGAAGSNFLSQRRHHVPMVFHRTRDERRFAVEIVVSYFQPGERELAVLYVRSLSERASKELAQLDSDLKYLAIFDAAPFPIFLISQLGLIIDANPRTVSLYGYTREQLIGMRATHMIPGAPSLGNLFLTQPTSLAACDHRRSNGERFIAETSFSYIRSPNQLVAVALVRDVTEERRYLSLLQDSEERWRFALEGAGDGVWDWDLAEGIINGSAPCLSIIGADVDTQILAPDSLWPERVHRDDRVRVSQAFQAHFSGESPLVDIEFRAHCAQRGQRWLALRGKVMATDAVGMPLRMIGTLRDVHEQYVQKERERLQQVDLAHAGRLITIGEMASALAHEINQPLTALCNFSAVCLKRLADSSTSKQDLLEPLQLIADQALRAGEIVQRIRRFAQKNTQGFVSVDLNDVVRDIVRLVEADARAMDVRIDVVMAPDLPPILGDAIQLGQVVTNLVKNGMDAMREVSGERRLHLATLNTGEWVEVHVTDMGSGIAPEVKDALFVPFVTTKPDGMGLGLAICHSIIEAHGGVLRAEANPGQGTTFVMRLAPLERKIR